MAGGKDAGEWQERVLPPPEPQKKMEVLRLRSRPPAPVGNSAQDDRFFQTDTLPRRAASIIERRQSLAGVAVILHA